MCSECFIFCGVFCKNICEIPAKCEIQKMYNQPIGSISYFVVCFAKTLAKYPRIAKYKKSLGLHMIADTICKLLRWIGVPSVDCGMIAHPIKPKLGMVGLIVISNHNFFFKYRPTRLIHRGIHVDICQVNGGSIATEFKWVSMDVF